MPQTLRPPAGEVKGPKLPEVVTLTSQLTPDPQARVPTNKARPPGPRLGVTLPPVRSNW